MDASLLTPRFTLVPTQFFDQSRACELLSSAVALSDRDEVRNVPIEQYNAVLVYGDDISGENRPLPEMFYILKSLPECKEYNKILCSWAGGYLFLAIAQGKSLLLANAWKAMDFTTAEYFIFNAMKSLQLNPEVSTICWRMPIGVSEEMSLYRYFKAVEQI